MIQVVGGIAVGAAAMMLVPSIMSTIAGFFKPVAKILIKGGLLAIESGKQAVHETQVAVASAVETIEDLSAEAKAEILESQRAEFSESQPAAVKKAKKKAA